MIDSLSLIQLRMRLIPVDIDLKRVQAMRRVLRGGMLRSGSDASEGHHVASGGGDISAEQMLALGISELDPLRKTMI